MTEKKMETAPRQQSQSPSVLALPEAERIGADTTSTEPIVTQLPADVKALRALRAERHIPVADIVEVVASIYPRFDRYLLSKVEHGEVYGIRLRTDAQHELMTHFRVTQENGSRPPRKPRRSKPKRITCRLTDEAYGALQRELERTGLTMQSYLENLIVKSLKGGNAHEPQD